MSLKQILRPSIINTLGSGYSATRFRDDVFGAITAAVVALPLALAFGVASGAGPIAGLYSAIACGFFAALFGGTGAQVSGPTGPMTVVMAAVVASHADSLAEAFSIVMLGGMMQIAFGLVGVGRYIAYAPVSVVSGFMSGVGVIIIVLQALPFIGAAATGDGVTGTLRELVTSGPQSFDAQVFALAFATLLLIIFWPARIARLLPSPLGALVAGTVAATLLIADLPVIGEVPTGLPGLVVPSITFGNVAQLLQPAFILALLGSIDSLLTSLVADSLTKTQHDSDKELVGQGIGNIVAGLIGAIPGAGATMRTVINFRAGGRTPVSGMLHALILLALALGLGPVVAHVPHAVLAAILMKVGWDIIDWGYWKRLHRIPREKAAVMLTTFLLTVLVDLIMAVAVGIIMASFVNSRWLAVEQLKGLKQSSGADDSDFLTPEERTLLRGTSGRVLVTLLHGSFSYASARELARRDTQAIADIDVVVYDFSHSGYIDPSAALAIDEMIDLSIQHGRKVLIAGLRDQALNALSGMGVLDRISADQQFEHRKEALDAAVAICRGS